MKQTKLTGGRGWLDAGAAASVHRIDAQLGHRLQITEAGRTYARQQELYDLYRAGKGSLAAHPDAPSVHQLGRAIDTNEGDDHIAVMEANGWRRTVRDKNGRLIEPWHWDYFANLDKRKNAAPAATTTTPPEQEDDMPISILERRDSAATKSLYNPTTGKAIRAISRDENTSYRRGVGTGAVVYVTVGDEEYKERGGK